MYSCYTEVHTAKQARVAGCGRTLFDKLNKMSSSSAEANRLGEEILTAYRAGQVSNRDALGGDHLGVPPG